jgi:hypothetical protein
MLIYQLEAGCEFAAAIWCYVVLREQIKVGQLAEHFGYSSILHLQNVGNYILRQVNFPFAIGSNQ